MYNTTKCNSLLVNITCFTRYHYPQVEFVYKSPEIDNKIKVFCNCSNWFLNVIN